MARRIDGLWHPRRLMLLGAVLVMAVLIPLVLGSSSGLATSGGDPYKIPNVVDVSPKPNVVETTLIAEPATVNIGNGVTAKAQTFNGKIPGPTFHLKVGQTVIVHYENHLDRQSAIHWHGIELPNEMDGTPFTQDMVPPGGTFLYKFTVNRPGLFWYHPHFHASTDQVFKGLYGMIIVKDPNDDALTNSGALPKETKPLVLSDTTVCKTPGSNDTQTYPLTMPHVSGLALAAQQPPTPKNLCEGPGLAGPPVNPYPIDEDGDLRGAFAAGDIPNIQTALHAGPTNEGQTVLTNGKNVGARAGTPASPGALASGASTMDVKPGQGLRLQLVNASAVRYMRLRLTGPTGTFIPLAQVGGEGGLLDYAVQQGGTQGTYDTKYDAGEILLPPGSRADVVAAFPASPSTGVATLWTEDFKRTGLGYSNIPTVPVAHFKLTGAAVSPPYTITGGSGSPSFPPAGTPLRVATGHPVEVLGPTADTLLNPASFSPPKLGMASPAIALTQNAQTDLGINGVFGTHDVSGSFMLAPHLGSTRYAKQDDTLDLSVANATGANHPFHLHGFSIQPKSLTKAANPTYTWRYPEFRDNVDIPAGYTLNFRVRLDRRPMVDGHTLGGALGRWLFHCHIFFHATNGMLGELVIAAGSGNERPNLKVNKGIIRVKQGDVAKINGTFGDPDGNLVDLKASMGTVTQTGSGSFSWKLQTKPTTRRNIVYITATDTQSLSAQIPFDLEMLPVKPVIKHLKVSPKRFRVGHRAKIKFNLSKGSKMTFKVKKVAPRRPKPRHKSFTRMLKGSGLKSVLFKGRIGGSALPPGGYRLIARARADKLNSKRVTTSFRIKP